MDEQPIRTLNFANYRADVYSTNFPGEFRIIYVDDLGATLEETSLTGISTYRQRESEILTRLRQLHADTQSTDVRQVESTGDYVQPANPSFPSSLSASA